MKIKLKQKLKPNSFAAAVCIIAVCLLCSSCQKRESIEQQDQLKEENVAQAVETEDFSEHEIEIEESSESAIEVSDSETNDASEITETKETKSDSAEEKTVSKEQASQTVVTQDANKKVDALDDTKSDVIIVSADIVEKDDVTLTDIEVVEISEVAIEVKDNNEVDLEAIEDVLEENSSEGAVVVVTTDEAIVDDSDDNSDIEAYAEYMRSFNKNLSEEESLYIADEMKKFADERDYLDMETLMGLACFESGFRPYLTGNYMGLMQVSLKYAQAAGYTEEMLLDPHYNLEYAMSMLDFGYEKLDGNLTYALLSYNQGYYAFKAKLDNGTEINTAFADKVYSYAEKIKAYVNSK